MPITENEVFLFWMVWTQVVLPLSRSGLIYNDGHYEDNDNNTLSGCGLRLDDWAVHIAIGLRLGDNICEPHQCPCGATVDAKGLHGLSCKGGPGRSVRHHALNDLIWRALSKADIPATKEPSGLLRTDCRRPDGVTLLPWKNGRRVTWDVTVTDTMAQSYISATHLVRRVLQRKRQQTRKQPNVLH